MPTVAPPQSTSCCNPREGSLHLMDCSSRSKTVKKVHLKKIVNIVICHFSKSLWLIHIPGAPGHKSTLYTSVLFSLYHSTESPSLQLFYKQCSLGGLFCSCNDPSRGLLLVHCGCRSLPGWVDFSLPQRRNISPFIPSPLKVGMFAYN